MRAGLCSCARGPDRQRRRCCARAEEEERKRERVADSERAEPGGCARRQPTAEPKAQNAPTRSHVWEDKDQGGATPATATAASAMAIPQQPARERRRRASPTTSTDARSATLDGRKRRTANRVPEDP
jgi:hypothetical protein